MLSIIIPMGGEDEKGQRLKNVYETLHCIEYQTYRDYEVILVEEVFKGNIIFDVVEVDQYIQVKAGRYSNRSWTRNIGAQAAHGDMFLQFDGDIIFGKDYFQRIVEYPHEWFIGWDTCYRLTPEGFNEWNLNEDLTLLQKYSDPYFGVIHSTQGGACGFSSCFSRQFYFYVTGGYNENFTGWGGEDDDISLRATHMLGDFYNLPYTIYHLPHGSRHGSNREIEKTIADPQGVTERLKNAKLGRVGGPTLV